MSTIISAYTLTITGGNLTDVIQFGKSTESRLVRQIIENVPGLTVPTPVEKAMLAVVNCDFSLEMFNPGHFSIELSLRREPTSGRDLPASCCYTQADVQSVFMGAKVKLEYSYMNSIGIPKTASMASGYFIHDVDTVVSSSDQNTMGIILDVYSMDKLLDLQPMTRAYTAQKLSGIFEAQIKEVNKMFKAKKNIMGDLQIEASNNLNVIRHTFKETKTEIEKGLPVTKEVISDIELIMPYLVQYNETFYSFLRRVCARSGEFLYWEDGKMQFGLKTSKPDDISSTDNGYKSVRSKANKSEFNVFKVSDWHRNSNESDAKKLHPSASYVTEGQVGNDDFLKELKAVKAPGNIASYLLLNPTNLFTKGFAGMVKGDNPFKLIFGLLRIVASGQTPEDVAVDCLVDLAWNSPYQHLQIARNTEIGIYNVNMLPENTKFKKTNPNYNYNAAEQKDSNNISHFSTVDSLAKKTDSLGTVNLGQLTESVYSQIKASATAAASKELIIDLDNYATELKLGSVVTIPGQGSEQFVITHISGTFTLGNDNRLQCHREAHAMPKAKYSDSCSLWLPAPIDNEIVKAQGPMTGFVTETADPYGQGRVRVRMSWQNTSNKDATPWVRVASPMAGKSGNMLVQPGIGDEVLVDFENGNMERPYVRGSLFNAIANTTIPSMHPSTPPKIDYSSKLLRTLQTGKGSGLFLEDESWALSDWIKMISPAAGNVMAMLPSVANPDEVTKMAVGAKVELKDYYGFYNISMSSKKRAVSISSPLGNISLSAFTGISISAPNGDITISGKNVTIKAGDRLTLSSGGNIIKKPKDKTLGGWTAYILATILRTVIDKVFGSKAVDLSLVRRVIEVFLRPVNGTLQIHSGRHLVLEAGQGKAEIPYDSIKAKANVELKNAINAGYPYYLMRQLFVDINDKSNHYSNMVINAYNAILDFKKNYLRGEINEIDCDNPKAEVYLKQPLAIRERLTVKKCKQIFNTVKKKDGKWVFQVDSSAHSNRMKYCPVPKEYLNSTYMTCHAFTDTIGKAATHDSEWVQLWLANVDKFGQLICDYKNALDAHSLAFDDAIDAIISQKTVQGDKKAMDAFNKIKTKLKKSGEQKYKLAYKEGDKIVELPELSATEFEKDDLKRATMVTVKNHHVTMENMFIFIKCLIDAKVISYVGDQPKAVDGSYEKNIAIDPDEVSLFIGVGKTEPNWDSFVSHLVPYFVDHKKDDFVDVFKAQFNDFKDKALDEGNKQALNRIISLNERDMWDATNNPGSIVMSAGKGSKTTRLEANGDFLAHDNASVKMLIESFKIPQVEMDDKRDNAVQVAIDFGFDVI